ncbi:unnamed protein product [Auanema sp. JU1783]|nr:unnamed protein product [Auanema sp. JU1783]
MMDLQFFLNCLSVSAIITTICLFFTGIPICKKILNQKSTQDICGIVFLMGFIGCSFWLRYGFLKEDNTMMIVNAVGSSLFLIYCTFYLVYTTPKFTFAWKYCLSWMLIISMLLYTEIQPNMDLLGIACMTFNILTFGAPLAGLGIVLRKKCCDSLPLPMCVANLLVSSQWLLYGNIVKDSYIMIPNGIGMALAVFQLCLFIVFPMNTHERSLLDRFMSLCSHPEISEPDTVEQSKCSSTTLTIDSEDAFLKQAKNVKRHSNVQMDDSIAYPITKTKSFPDVSRLA